MPVVALHDGGEVLAAEDDCRGDAVARATAPEELDEVGAPSRFGGASERVLVQRVDEVRRIARALARVGEILVGRHEGQLELLDGDAGADLSAPVGETAGIGGAPEELVVQADDHVVAVLATRDECRGDGASRRAAVERVRPVAQAVGVGNPPEQVRVDLLYIGRHLGDAAPAGAGDAATTVTSTATHATMRRPRRPTFMSPISPTPARYKHLPKEPRGTGNQRPRDARQRTEFEPSVQ